MKCPVCNYENIGEGVQRCPNCGSDLESFHALQRLSKKNKSGRTYIIILWILILLLIAGLVLMYFLMKGNSADVRDQNDQLNEQVTQLAAENEQLEVEKHEAESKLEVFESEAMKPEEPEFIKHKIVYGETLYKIAEKYYQDGWQYPKIACDNGIEDPDFILAGKTIYIYK